MGSMLLSRRVLPKRGSLTLSAGVITDATRLAGVEGDGITWPFGGVYVGPGATNYCRYGNSAGTGWANSATGSSTPSTVADYLKFGAQSISFGGDGAYSDQGVIYTTPTAGEFAVGDTVPVRVWLYSPDARSFKLASTERNAAGAYLAESSTTVAVSAGVWTEITAVRTYTDAAASRASLRVTVPGTVGSAWSARLSGVGIQKSALMTPYIHTNGSPVTRTVGTVAGVPASILNLDTGGGLAFRWRAGLPSTSTVRPRLLQILSGNHFLVVYFDPISDRWLLARDNGSGAAASAVSAVQSFAVGDYQTIFVEWAPSQMSIQVNTETPVVSSDSKGPASANVGATFGFGTSGEQPTGHLMWVYGWKGSLSSENRARLVALGNFDPLPHQLSLGRTPAFLYRAAGSGAGFRYAA